MKKILIAEDELGSKKIMKKCVEACGHVPVLSSNGRRAWEVLCDNDDFSMLITDISMPDMDGRELIHHVRASAVNKDIPIIIVSGVVGPKEISDLIEKGASRFLPKPITVEHLKEYIELLLKRQSLLSRETNLSA